MAVSDRCTDGFTTRHANEVTCSLERSDVSLPGCTWLCSPRGSDKWCVNFLDSLSQQLAMTSFISRTLFFFFFFLAGRSCVCFLVRYLFRVIADLFFKQIDSWLSKRTQKEKKKKTNNDKNNNEKSPADPPPPPPPQPHNPSPHPSPHE